MATAVASSSAKSSRRAFTNLRDKRQEEEDDNDNDDYDSVSSDDESEEETPTFCTFAATGTNPSFQAIFTCLDCNINCNSSGKEAEHDGDTHRQGASETTSSLSCMCRACAETCHAGHDVDFVGMGPAYCDCQALNSCCKLANVSQQEARRIGLPLDGLKQHHAPVLLLTTTTTPSQCQQSLSATINGADAKQPRTSSYIQEAFTISCLNDDRTCDRLVREAMELVQHSRDTHWIDLKSSRERPQEKYSKLEELALTILSHHTKAHQLISGGGGGECHNTNEVDVPSGVGAEWWVQVKPISLSTRNSNESSAQQQQQQQQQQQLDDHDWEKPHAEEAVDLHYDKDEVLAESFDLGSFPTLSTVTYLSSTPYASPTIVFPHCYDDDEGEVMDEMLVSFPRRGKHLVFDGRLLHGAPAHFALRASSTGNMSGTERQKCLMNRVTFLVNLWVESSRPSGIKPLSRDIRQCVRTAGKRRNNKLPTMVRQQQKDAVHFVPRAIAAIDLEKEDDLPEPLRGRIVLPFVSKGATWISRVKAGNGLVVVTFPPPPTTEDTVSVKFGPGLQAYLDYQSEDNLQGSVDINVSVDTRHEDEVDYV